MDRARLEIDKITEESSKLYAHREKGYIKYISTLTDANTKEINGLSQ